MILCQLQRGLLLMHSKEGSRSADLDMKTQKKMLVTAWSKLDFFLIVVGIKYAVCIIHISHPCVVSQIASSSEDPPDLLHLHPEKYTC